MIDFSTHITPHRHPKVLERVFEALKTPYVGMEILGSMHPFSQQCLSDIKKYMDDMKRLLGARQEDEIRMVSSGAEAINDILLSFYIDEIRESGKNHILTTVLEEVPAMFSCKRLEDLGCSIGTIVPNSQGQITVDLVKEAIRPRTSLLSLSWANKLTGVIHPIEEIAHFCQSQGIKVHVDASTVVGKLFFNFADLGIDYLTVDGQAMGSPLGGGILLTKEKKELKPLILGDASMHREAVNALESVSMETARLKGFFEKRIQSLLPGSFPLYEQAERLPHISAMVFERVHAEALLFLLSQKGLFASLGGGFQQSLPHLLRASGFDPALSHGVISFSITEKMKEEDLEEAIQLIYSDIEKLQKHSEKISLGLS
jgi:cysteine desulfurase